MTLTDEEIRVKALKILGWKNVRRTTIWKNRVMREGIFGTPPGKDSDLYPNEPTPDPLIDPADALQLCDRMHSEGWYEKHERLPEGEWKVIFRMPGRFPVSSSDPSLARAVTLCFLAAHSNE